MPFISEEIWSGIKKKDDCPMIIKKWPKTSKIDKILLNDFNHVSRLITGIRNYRNKNGISYKKKLNLITSIDLKEEMTSIVLKLCNSEINFDKMNTSKNLSSIIVDSKEYFVLDIDDKQIDFKKIKGELDYNIGFLKSIQSKLNNKRFIENAPKIVIKNEKKKEKDTLIKIEILEKKLKK